MNTHNALPDIRDVKPRTETDAPLFAELAAVLDKYNARDRFGIALLHKHFDLNDGEVLLEETDVEGRIQSIKPVAGADIPARHIETIWSLNANGTTERRCICPEDLKGNHSGRHIRVGG